MEIMDKALTKATNDFSKAGYPVDAKRFREQIRSVQKQLDVSDERLWRNR